MLDMKQVDDIINKDIPDRHTYFQLNFFVLGKEPTHQAKLKRCVEELRSRKRSIEAIDLEIADLQDQNELTRLRVKNQPNTESGKIEKRILERKVGAVVKSVLDLQVRKNNITEEMIFFVEAFEKLSQVEPLKQWDDIEVQGEYWNAKITEEVNHRILMQLPINADIIKTALSLPFDLPVKKNIEKLLSKQTDKILKLEKGSKDAETC